MKPAVFRLRSLLPGLLILSTVILQATEQAPGPRRTGVLLLAHGGSAAWNANVEAIAAEVDSSTPTEVALGMATRANIQRAVDRLGARGVTEIVAVPLFVSTHSSVITSTEYLLGLRKDMPADLATFAKMAHGTAGEHSEHTTPAEDGTRPVQTGIPIRMTQALDAHPLIADILASRAAAISQAPATEATILVAHGPVADDVNERWLVNLRSLAAQVQARAPYAVVDAITVRDDAPTTIRDAATRELRQLVERRLADGRRVLVVPVLLSYGGIEAGIRTRLDGLQYTMAPQALAPDPKLAQWVRAMVDSSIGNRQYRLSRH